MKKTLILAVLLLVGCCNSNAFAITGKVNTLTTVFNKLVNAYGNSKSAPALTLSPKSSRQKYVATYLATPAPTIVVDEQLFDLCMQMGADSLNALSIIVSHELAHYYNDHHWCTDFAFALSKQAKSTAEKEKNYWHSKEEKTIHEGEADNFGLYHSCIAGYSPFNVYSRLLDKIYTAYGLPEKMNGYPSKNERKQISIEAQSKIDNLYKEFVEGIAAITNKNYEKAISCFDNLTKHFPSRENYNNLGTARTLWSLELKPKERIEYVDTNFYYPIETDHKSRLNSDVSRGDDDNDEKMTALLKSAKRDFEKAISLDPEYDMAYINLACVYDLLSNWNAAIGKINEMPIDKQKQEKAYRILGIVYFHMGDEAKSKEIFMKIKFL